MYCIDILVEDAHANCQQRPSSAPESAGLVGHCKRSGRPSSDGARLVASNFASTSAMWAATSSSAAGSSACAPCMMSTCGPSP